MHTSIVHGFPKTRHGFNGETKCLRMRTASRFDFDFHRSIYRKVAFHERFPKLLKSMLSGSALPMHIKLEKALHKGAQANTFGSVPPIDQVFLRRVQLQFIGNLKDFQGQRDVATGYIITGPFPSLSIVRSCGIRFRVARWESRNI